MKTKLLDLQTSEFLEKGKDWLDGGEYIVLMKYYTAFRGVKENFHIEANSTDITNSRYIKSNTKDLPEPLKSVVEKLGVSVYGGRYVLIKSIILPSYFENQERYIGDIINCGYTDGKLIHRIHTKFKFSDEDEDSDNYISSPITNIFTELSKHLRNEPNSFEEFKKLIGLN